MARTGALADVTIIVPWSGKEKLSIKLAEILQEYSARDNVPFLMSFDSKGSKVWMGGVINGPHMFTI